MLIARLEYGVGIRATSRVKLPFNWDGGSTDWAMHVFGEIPLGYLEAVPLDDCFSTVGAVRVLCWMTRYVA